MSYTSLKYHIVFSTKERRRLILPDVLPRLVEYVGGIARQRKARILAANGPEDHLHLLASIPPTMTVSDFLRDIKSNSSSWVHETFSGLRIFGWQDEYAAFTVSQSAIPQVTEYIQNQQEHHKTMTFQEELIALLKRHEIEFDERYIKG
jgi:REP element-mobilizing transposase RayT